MGAFLARGDPLLPLRPWPIPLRGQVLKLRDASLHVKDVAPQRTSLSLHVEAFGNALRASSLCFSASSLANEGPSMSFRGRGPAEGRSPVCLDEIRLAIVGSVVTLSARPERGIARLLFQLGAVLDRVKDEPSPGATVLRGLRPLASLTRSALGARRASIA